MERIRRIPKSFPKAIRRERDESANGFDAEHTECFKKIGGKRETAKFDFLHRLQLFGTIAKDGYTFASGGNRICSESRKPDCNCRLVSGFLECSYDLLTPFGDCAINAG